MRFALLVAVAAIALGLAGCGSDAPEAAPVTSAPLVAYQPPPLPPLPPPAPLPPITDPDAPKADPRCTRSRRAPGYRMCLRDRKNVSSTTIERRDGGTWRIVSWEPRGWVSYGEETHRGTANGQWASLWLSPDGRTLLAQWNGECETRYAFFVPARGGEPWPVTGRVGKNESPPEAFAHGWAADGRAEVYVVGETGCGGTKWQSGVYLINPATGDATFLHS